jgi:hypothetical protein
MEPFLKILKKVWVNLGGWLFQTKKVSQTILILTGKVNKIYGLQLGYMEGAFSQRQDFIKGPVE